MCHQRITSHSCSDLWHLSCCPTWRPSHWCRCTESHRRQTDRCRQRRRRRTGMNCHSCRKRKTKQKTFKDFWKTSIFILLLKCVCTTPCRKRRGSWVLVFTWRHCKVVCTNRRMSKAWRAGTKGWTDQSPRPGLRPQWTRPDSWPCWPAGFQCGLEEEDEQSKKYNSNVETGFNKWGRERGRERS